MSVSLPGLHSSRSKGSSGGKGKRTRFDNSGSKVLVSKISSEYIPEEEHESSIIDEVLPGSSSQIKLSINPFSSYT